MLILSNGAKRIESSECDDKEYSDQDNYTSKKANEQEASVPLLEPYPSDPAHFVNTAMTPPLLEVIALFIDILFLFTSNVVCIINNKNGNKDQNILLISPNVSTTML